MNIVFPSKFAVQSALSAEFYVIECLTLNCLYYKSAFVDAKSNWVICGFATYNYYDADLEETIYMCVDFTYDTENEVFYFGEFIEPGGFDSEKEAEEYLFTLYNAKKV